MAWYLVKHKDNFNFSYQCDPSFINKKSINPYLTAAATELAYRV